MDIRTCNIEEPQQQYRLGADLSKCYRAQISPTAFAVVQIISPHKDFLTHQ